MLLKDLKEKKNFTGTEKELAAFISENAAKAVAMNQETLAAEAYVSPSAISRFVKKMGFAKYNDFKVALAKELEAFEGKAPDNNFPFDRNDTPSRIAKNIYHSSLSGMKQIIEDFDEDLIKAICHDIEKKKAIDIYGVGSSANSAYLFAEYMTRISHPCFIHDNFSDHMLRASLDNDYFKILISHSGKLSYMIDIAGQLKEKNKDFLFITANRMSPIVKYAKYCIYLNSGENLSLSGKLGMFSSQSMECFVLNIIYSCVFADDYDKNAERLERSALYQSGAFEK